MKLNCRVAFLLALVVLTSCQSLPTPLPTPNSAVATAAALAETTVVESETPPPTSTPSSVNEPAPIIVSQPVSQKEPASAPLRFVFPTPAPVPVSAWRPPLYPTPWAPTPYDHFFFARPIAADEVNWPVADYRYGGVFLPGVVHTGIDIPVNLGTPVQAAGPGRVTWTGYGLYRGVEDETDPYGLAVAIKHDFGYQGEALYTMYGHLSRVDVLPGQHVEAGETIGLSGETGKVTGPHLHFEIRIGKNNYFVSRNPELWMSPPQGWGILAARLLDNVGAPVYSQQVSVISKETGQTWYVNSYGEGTVNSDPYYRENLVLGDLPAGDYTVWVPYEGTTFNTEIRIYPGMVSYFSFKGMNGIRTEPPPTPAIDFTPPDQTATPIP